jgi:hypothetical protein
VATLDGLNQYGFPYFPSLVNNQLARDADTLTSRAINLRTTVTSQTLQPSDSVAISFYYQARGFGDPPELIDSLILDLYKPLQGTWNNNVWFQKGNFNGNVRDTIFKRGFVWLKDTAYLRDGFKFRFRNKSSSTGNFDLWHLDYIYLNKNRSQKADTIYEDLTFAYVPTPFLKDYSAMPFQQYVAAEITPTISIKIRNNGKDSINMTYRHTIRNETQQVKFYDGGANVLGQYNKVGYSKYIAHATPSVSFVFPQLPDSLDYVIKHYVFESGVPTDFISQNDTVIQFQKFRNYYALDDGSAEQGYYLNVAQAKLAIKINVYVADSFLGARIYFDPVTNVNAQMNSAGFRINVWADGSNGPGQLLARDTIFKPKYYNVAPSRSFAEYKLLRKQFLQPGTYYIGIEQLADYMTIGFDKNTDHHLSTYYNFGPVWKQSEEIGSVMIRPIFGKTLPRYQSFNEAFGIKQGIFAVFPNPANDQLYIQSETDEKASWSLFNSLGQLVDKSENEAAAFALNTHQHNNGLYLLEIKSHTGQVQQQKIIISHE